MKEYALYDVKDYEQLVFMGTLKEIANYLDCRVGSLRSYLTKKKRKKQVLFKHRYELAEIMNTEEIEAINEKSKKSNKEIWKKIPDFEYSISNYGRIRNDKRNKIKGTRIKNYMLVTDLYKNGNRYTLNVVRMEAELFIRHLLKNERIRHIDGDSRNNFIGNLEIVSK